MDWATETDDGWLVRFRITPRASKTQIVGEAVGRSDGQSDGQPAAHLRIRVAAPPVDGQANDALVRFVAKKLGVGRSGVTIVRGLTGRSKTVRVPASADLHLLLD